MIRALLFTLVATLCWILPATAHEVRPAYLEIVERGDGRADVTWKQPSIGILKVALRPSISGVPLDNPQFFGAADNFELRRWSGIDLKGRGLNGREVRIAGLDKTITDALVLVHFRNGDNTSEVLTPVRPGFTIDAHAGAAVSAYLMLGIEHILTGVDHLLFVFGLVMLSAGWRQLVRTITAFTVAHSITLALTALKVISVSPQLVEALVAWSILFLAVELVRKQRGAEGLTQRYPWLIAFSFGLLHGAAFAGALRQIGLPDGNVPLALFLFNIGVELGQLLFVGCVLGVFTGMRRLPLPAAAARYGWAAASYAIGSFSTFWFLERVTTAFEVATSWKEIGI